MTLADIATLRTLRNPYWDAVKGHLSTDYDGGLMAYPYGDRDGGLERYANPAFTRHDLVARYSWTITDPATVEFVARHIVGSVVDPLAGSGWWLAILAQLGIDCVGYDLNPPSGGGNTWHKLGVEHVDIRQADAAEAVTAHPDGTLLLSWPPYDDDTGARVLRAYAGSRVVYIGESDGGCCGDDEMHRLLSEQWAEVATHRPIQHFGLRDWVTVYDRADVATAAHVLELAGIRGGDLT